MVRNPGHFEIKHFANTKGARRQVVEALAARLDVRPGSRRHRVSNVLFVVSNLVSQVRRLDNYTLHTRHLRPSTLKMRDALVAAVEPDELLFRTLPAALELPPIPAGARTYARADAYADRVGVALEDLSGCLDRLLDKLFKLLIEASGEATRQKLTTQAAAIDSAALNPDVRAMVLTMANDDTETNGDWIQAVATVLLRKAPAEWSDDDLARFRQELPEQVAAFQRLAALHAARPANGAVPSRALRVTFTRPDGAEHVRLVDLDEDKRQSADAVFDRNLGELVRIVGSPQGAHAALLAILGERLLPRSSDRPSHADRLQQREPAK